MAILLCNFSVNSARFRLGSLDFSNLKNIPIAWNGRNLSMTWHFWKNRNLHFQNWLQQVRDHVLYLLDFLGTMLVRDTLLQCNRLQSNFRRLWHCQSVNSRNIFVNVIFDLRLSGLSLTWIVGTFPSGLRSRNHPGLYMTSTLTLSYLSRMSCCQNFKWRL